MGEVPLHGGFDLGARRRCRVCREWGWRERRRGGWHERRGAGGVVVVRWSSHLPQERRNVNLRKRFTGVPRS